MLPTALPLGVPRSLPLGRSGPACAQTSRGGHCLAIGNLRTSAAFGSGRPCGNVECSDFYRPVPPSLPPHPNTHASQCRPNSAAVPPTPACPDSGSAQRLTHQRRAPTDRYLHPLEVAQAGTQVVTSAPGPRAEAPGIECVRPAPLALSSPSRSPCPSRPSLPQESPCPPAPALPPLSARGTIDGATALPDTRQTRCHRSARAERGEPRV